MDAEPAAAPSPYEVYTTLLSHELRTPVNAMLGYLELLEEDEALRADPAALLESLARVRGRAADLVRLVAELTTFTDLLNGQGPSPRPAAPASLTDLVRGIARGRPLRLAIDPTAAAARADPDRLRIVLAQLLDNAYRFGTPSAEVAVAASVEGDPPRLVVRVRNDGPPIHPELRAAIFEPFAQGEAPHTRRHSGLGLGLTVARRAAEGAGGGLTLEPGSPTTFRLELPLREDTLRRELEELRWRESQANAQALAAIAGHHERFDGTGYPRGLAGEAIPLAARLIAVADAYDAMMTDRPYRKALPASARSPSSGAAGAASSTPPSSTPSCKSSKPCRPRRRRNPTVNLRPLSPW
jgi:hypothetical protein